MLNNSCSENVNFSDSSDVFCELLTDVTYHNSQAKYLQKEKDPYFEMFGGICIFFLWIVVGAFIMH
jgi:phosphate starvation-inducible membrane PsiE